MISLFRYFLSTSVLALLLLPSCSTTTKLTSVWRDDGYQDHPKKMMIIGGLKTPGNRRIFEDEMVKQLKAVGTDAVVSYAAIPEQAGADRDTIAAKMNDLGADAVLIARVVDKKTVTTYVPGARPGPRSGSGGGWHGDYAYPGYTVQDEFAVLQTNLYDLKSDQLIWTAVSETSISEDNDRLIRSFTRVIIDRLVSDRMLAAGPAK